MRRTILYRIVVFVVILFILVAELNFDVALWLERHPILVGHWMLRERGLVVGYGTRFGMIAPSMPEEAALSLEGARTPVAVKRSVSGVGATMLAEGEFARKLLAAHSADKYSFAALKYDMVAHIRDHHSRFFWP